MSTPPHGDRAPNPIDVHVGQRIRARRKALGVSQEKLADELGLTFQQVQKYERGANRVSASKLWEIARVLQVEIAALFEGVIREGEGRYGVAEAAAPFTHDEHSSPEATEITALMSRMDRNRRRMLVDLARTLAGDAGAAAADSES